MCCSVITAWWRKKWQWNILWVLLQSMICFILYHLAALVKILETLRPMSSMSTASLIFKRSMIKSEKEQKIFLWLKRESESRATLYVGKVGKLFLMWEFMPSVFPQYNRKIILMAFMGNWCKTYIVETLNELLYWQNLNDDFLLLKLYTSIYYRLSFVLCCSNWHQTLLPSWYLLKMSWMCSS